MDVVACSACRRRIPRATAESSGGGSTGQPWSYRCGGCAGAVAPVARSGRPVFAVASARPPEEPPVLRLDLDPHAPGDARVRLFGRLGDYQGLRRAARDAGAVQDSKARTWRLPTVGVPRFVRAIRAAFPALTLEAAPALESHLRASAAAAREAAEAAGDRIQAIRAELAARGDLRLRGFQEEGVAWLTSPEHRRALLADSMGTGKQQPVDTKVMTPVGWREIGSLSVGDSVIGSDGAPTTVTGVFPQGRHDSWRVHLSDGASVEAGAEHLWAVDYRCGGKRWERLVLTTEQLRDRPTVTSPSGRALDLAKTRLYVPTLAGPAQSSAARPAVGGYVMGAILANGGLTCGTPTLVFGARDWPDVVAELHADGADIGTERRYENTVHACVRSVLDHLRDLGLAGLSSADKFIPMEYLNASPCVRRDLLCGLMDADGSITPTRNRIKYHTISARLATDVRELVEGLGGIATVHRYDRTAEGKPVEYSVRIRVPLGVDVFRVRRKRDRHRPANRSRPTRTVASVEFARRGVEQVCIAVSAHDRLYATEHGILTHNTIQALVALPPRAAVVVVCPASVRGSWEHHVRVWRPDLEPTILRGRAAFQSWPEPGRVLITSYGSLPVTPAEAEEAATCGRCDGVGRVVGSTDPCPACDGGALTRQLRLASGGGALLGRPTRDTVLVADECHRLKNPRAKQRVRWNRLVAGVAESDGRVIGLSGSPLLNRRREVWSILQALGGLGERVFGTPARMEALATGDPTTYATLLRRVMLRRLKADVLRDLPPLTIEDRIVEINDRTRAQLDELLEELVRRAAEKAEEIARRQALAAGLGEADARLAGEARAEEVREDLDEAIGMVLDRRADIPFELMSRVKTVLASAKLPATLDILDDSPSEPDDDGKHADPWVVFSAHVASARAVADRRSWDVLDGEASRARRESMIDGMQAGDLAGLALTLAGGEGITLTRAARFIWNDLDWTPARNQQVVDRIHRFTQDRPVHAYRMIADHPLDAHLVKLNEIKLREQETFIDVAAVTTATPDPGEAGDVDEDPLAGVAVTERADPSDPNAPRGPVSDWEAWAANTLHAARDADARCRYFDAAWNGTMSGVRWTLAVQLARNVAESLGLPGPPEAGPRFYPSDLAPGWREALRDFRRRSGRSVPERYRALAARLTRDMDAIGLSAWQLSLVARMMDRMR